MSALSKLLSHVSSWNPRKRLAEIGAKGEPIATPIDLIVKFTIEKKMSLGCGK